ncbi:sensor histidine kinase [Leptospira sp. GIMC2001]|uniref:sensor histidine kinase n=1 Tax=Leptospira sp. GIMC2001 TaxID=1513297 RepID=UPI00234BF9D5|nr:sensor histidine kinase [Leptospira sp. GIMC2001]WCL48653.1 sensor histidine kinase [Leptospira sp. GIMC2001]
MFPRSSELYYNIQNSKGILFVVLSGAVIFFLLSREKKSQSQLHESIKDFESSIQTTIQEKSILVAEIHHRVKNNLAIICSFLELQKEYISNDASDPGLRAFHKSINRIKTMSIMHEILYENPGSMQVKFGKFLSGYWSYIQRASSIYLNRLSGQVDFKSDSLSESLDFGLGVNLGIITNELVLQSLENSFSKTDPKAVISISLFKKDGQFCYEFQDNGSNRQPTDWKEGLGMKILESIAVQIKGKFSLNDTEGLHFSLQFPEN